MSIKKQFKVAVVNEENIAHTGVTYVASQTVSPVFNCEGVCPTQIFFPSNWTAGNISFLVSKLPNGPFVPLTNFDGSALSIATTASMCLPLNPALFNSVLFLQLVSSVAQTDAAVVDFGLAPIFQGVHN
jgi:hypothetical protein